MIISNKLVTPLITIALIVLGYYQLASSDGQMTPLDWVQLGSVLVGAIVTYMVRIVPGKWPAVLKVAGAVIGAILATIATAIIEGTVVNTNLLAVILISALNAFAAQTGTDARVDTVKAAIADPDVNTQAAILADPSAAAVAKQQLALGHWSDALNFNQNTNSGQHRRGN